MAETMRASIKPELLVWARESACYSVEEAASKCRVKPEKLISWESGAGSPTVNQLRRLGRVYKRPLAVFYLPEPPRKFQAMHDFRRASEGGPRSESPALSLEIRKARQRREVALSLYQDLDLPAPKFDLKPRRVDNADDLALEIRTALGVSTQMQREWPEAYSALNAWRSILEGHGVLVFQATGVSIDEMRGFSISDVPLPIIVLNVKDSPRGRIFTMLHELSHVVLREGGLCDLDEGDARRQEDRTIEVFCNRVAAALLIPRESILSEELVRIKGPRSSWSDEELDILVRHYNASKEATLLRLLALGLTTEAFYRGKREEFQRAYAEKKKRTKGFAPPDVMAISSAGRTFVNLVLNSYHREIITSSDLSDFLGVRLKHVPRIEDAMRYDRVRVASTD